MKEKYSSLSNLFSTNSTFFNLINTVSNKPYKIFYTGLIPKPIRKWLARKADLSQQNHVANCWKKIISLYINDELDEIIITPKKDLKDKKIIWQYWGQGWNSESLPEVVKICSRSVQMNKGNYEVIYLDDQNISEYIEFPDFIYEKRKNTHFRHVFFSDLLRLALLKVYGGVWVDATFLFTDPISAHFSTMEFFVFQRSIQTKYKEKWQKLNGNYFSWKENHRVNFLSSIMFSKRENNTVNKLLQLMLFFWKTQECIPHYFFFQILFDELKREGLIDEFEIIDDTLPHLLFSELNSPFDKGKLGEILAQCNQHKLTYVKDYLPNSFYDYFKEKYR
jgi:capsular polysaccharide synthesis